jgi:hypothetical protein
MNYGLIIFTVHPLYQPTDRAVLPANCLPSLLAILCQLHMAAVHGSMRLRALLVRVHADDD